MDGILLLFFIAAAVISLSKSAARKNRPAPQKPAASAAEQKVQSPAHRTPIQPTVSSRVAPSLGKAAVNASKTGHTHSVHVVEPSFYGGHAHEENSMAGPGKDCETVDTRPRPTEEMESSSATPAQPSIRLDFGPNQVVNGLLYAEILGKPKALR